MRKIVALFAGVVLASSAKAAVVTYSLSLHEGSSGLPVTTNSFAIYATVSPADNAGLFAYGVDLTGTGDVGGPTTLTLTNRTPSGTWDADPNDPNLMHWNKVPENPVVPAPPTGLRISDWRDPALWNEGGDWYMIIGAGEQ